MAEDAQVVPAIFEAQDRVYKADTCDPVKVAVEKGQMRNVALVHGAYPGQQLPAKCLPELCCIGYWDITKDQSWGLGDHRNEGLELSFISRGKLHAGIAGHETELRTGSLTVIRPWQVHSWGKPNITACRQVYFILDVGVRRPDQEWVWPDWLVLSPEDVRRLTMLLRHNEQSAWKAPALGEAFDKICKTVDTWSTVPSESRLRLCINELLISLLEMLESRNIPLDESLSSAQRTVDLFLAALPQHVAHPWDLELMAEQCGLARSRFAHYCKLAVNQTPMEFLVRCRVHAAQKLLREKPELGVIEVASACGFQSAQYFSTVFKARTGLSPREFASGKKPLVE